VVTPRFFFRRSLFLSTSLFGRAARAVSRLVWTVKLGAESHKVLAGLGVAIALFAVVIYIPKLSFVQPGGQLKPEDRAKAESDLRGHLIQAIGGIVLIVGAYFTGRTFALNREGQHTERFTRAVEQLGSEKLDIRLGGIYALERIAHDSKSHYEPVMQVLTAFLREHARWRPESGAVEAAGDWPRLPAQDTSHEPDQPREPSRIDADFQAAATVIGRRDRRHEQPNQPLILDLRNVDLRGASLEWADLERALLIDAHLEGANLYGARMAYANLQHAYLDRANLNVVDLENANLVEAHLKEANLWGANLKFSSLNGARFDRAILRTANLDSALLFGTHLEEADLTLATGVTQEALAHAVINKTTQLPQALLSEAGD
jgi:Pentapeptide repeats (8 copies)